MRKRQPKRTVEEWAEIAIRLTEENGGILPSTLWLSVNGYAPLRDVMSQYPELFKLLPRAKRGRPSKQDSVQ